MGLSSGTPAAHSTVSIFWIKHWCHKFFFAVSDVRTGMPDCWGKLARVPRFCKGVEKPQLGAEEANVAGGFRVQEI